MSDTSGGKVKRTVVLIILIIFAVVTPAWSKPLRNTNIDYVLDLYKKVESFGFYKDSEGAEPIGTKTVNDVSTAYSEGTPSNPLEIKPEKQNNTPQYYYIIRSNYKDRSYKLNLSVSTFNDDNNSIGYKLIILDLNNTTISTIASEEITVEKYKDGGDVSLTYLNNVTSDTKPEKWVWGFYYLFDDELNQAAEGEYIATVKMEVTVQ